MAKITLKGNPIETIGDLPKVGTPLPDFCLTKTDLAETTLKDYAGKRLVLNIFPSIDTPVCAASVRRFNQEASNLANTVVLCVSADLPFAHKRFCGAEGINNVISLSDYRYGSFAKTYGVGITTGALKGVHSRAVVIANESGKVIYTEQVPDITQDPNFDAALKALK